MKTFVKAALLGLAISAKAFAADVDSADSLDGAFADEDHHYYQQPVGGDYCTWSPDMDCYPSTYGHPSCCMMRSGNRNCPRQRPACERRPTPNRRPTRAPTRRPTGRTTRPPTRNPTRRPSGGSSPTARCVPDERPRPVRDGQRYRFNLVSNNAECVDDRDQLYESGLFTDTTDFSDCAEKCVNTVPSSLINGGSFRGFDYDCSRRECQCLYDMGTLNSRNADRFERTRQGTRFRATGSISGTTPRSSVFCGKLVGAEAVEDVVAEA